MRELGFVLDKDEIMTKAGRKVKRILFSRVVIIGALIIAQLLILLLFVLRLSRYFAAMYGVFMFLSAAVALMVINKDDNPSYKLAWIIPILLFPLFGGLFYLLFGNARLSRKISKRICDEESLSGLSQSQSEQAEKNIKALSPSVQNQSRYLFRAGYPAYAGSKALYLTPGERKFEEMLKALKSAKRYIFLEYFIIEHGFMWDSILEVLLQKAREGVEIRVMYDGFGCLTTLPDNYFKELREKGIHCIEFNPLIPVFTMFMNNRDHRKILVVDGHIGFMGGINIADEYINKKQKLGHWKDSALMLQGEAVWSLTAMFVTMWNAVSEERCELNSYHAMPYELPLDCEGVIQPYSDTPLDREQVGETVYLNMINKAEKYIYICSPYLIVDNETVTALIMAAKSGVDVRIITPHHGDKWYVHMITRAHYAQLVKGGVKIYEYTPGFIHSKTFVADDAVATVGTVNLDYRSLYLHFECGVWLADCKAVNDIHDDFITTLQKCELMTAKSPQVHFSGIRRLICAVLKLFAPLM